MSIIANKFKNLSTESKEVGLNPDSVDIHKKLKAHESSLPLYTVHVGCQTDVSEEPCNWLNFRGTYRWSAIYSLLLMLVCRNFLYQYRLEVLTEKLSSLKREVEELYPSM